MAYVLKRNRIRDVRQEFRKEFPELCPPAKPATPLDFTVLKKEEEVVKPVQGLPPGWIHVRTYLQQLKPYVPPELDAHTLMQKWIQESIPRWEKWDREHGTFVNYNHYDDGLTYDDVNETTSESSYAEDPEDDWSD